MERLPYIEKAPSATQRIVGEFKGLDERLITSESTFSAMKNMSCRDYPAISTRKPRGTTTYTITKPHGMIYKNGIFYVDGTSCYYKGTLISGLTVTDDDKQLVGMGAYICIFPDKKIYNTSTGAIEVMGATFTQSSNAVYTPLSTGSAFTKITCTGIGTNFDVNDGVTISGSTATEVDYNGVRVVIEKDTDYIVVVGKITNTYTQASGLTITREIPTMDYVCEFNNRLWGCSSANHEIYSSALGNPKNWKNYEGVSTSSYAMTVGSDGDFTGCIAHLGYVLFFKENVIHIMYGTKPANYSLNTKTLAGVKSGCSKSLCTVNESLYYVGSDGVYRYDGATPIKISEGIEKTLSSAVSCQQDGKLYISCQSNSAQTLYVYATEKQIWNVEDDTQFKYASYGDGVLYYVDKNNVVKTITGNDTDKIEWFIESGDLTESSLVQKYITKSMFNFSMGSDAEANIFFKYDDDPLWHRQGTVKSINNTTYTIPLIAQRCNKFRWRIEGKGQFKLLGMSVDVEQGSNIIKQLTSGYRR